MKTQNLLYKIKRIFLGESGIIVKIEDISADEKSNYTRDSYGRCPKKITFKNPLGELVTATSQLDKFRLPKGLSKPNYIKMYKDYSFGMDFP